MITDVTTNAAPVLSPRDTQAVTPRAQLDSASASVDGDKEFSLTGDGDFTFWDFLDVINPLQHIPIVNGIYRELTGDTIKPVMKLAGGTLFGGPIGLALSTVDVGIQGTTGKDTGEHLQAMLKGEEDQRGTAYHLYNEAHSEEPWRDNSAAVAAADAAMAKLKAQETRVADAASAPIALPTLTITPATADAAPEAEAQSADADVLPPWDAPLASAAATPAAPMLPGVGTVATGVTSTGPHKTAGKEFATPTRHNSAYADAPRSLGEIQASRTAPGVRANPNMEAVQPTLSPAAMEAAGLSPETVQQVLKDHAPKPAANAASETSKAAPTLQPIQATTQAADTGSEPLWFFDKMSEGLNKYRAAQSLSPTPTPLVATP
jgi:hypothetical protein